MDTHHHRQETTMREEPAAFDAWLRRDLSNRYGRTVHEPLPDELLALLDTRD